MKYWMLFVPIACLLGCSHARPVETQASNPVSAPAPLEQAAPAPAQEAAQPVATPAPAPEVKIKTESIYFDFDKSDLKPEGQEFLASFGTLLASHPDLHVRIEGNCDERGTTEYNLLLGQRRADSAKGYLVRMGATREQIQTMSYGKERPLATGHNEAAWRQNRRDDFVTNRDTLPGKPVAANP